jgi:hypothetical protein
MSEILTTHIRAGTAPVAVSGWGKVFPLFITTEAYGEPVAAANPARVLIHPPKPTGSPLSRVCFGDG